MRKNTIIFDLDGTLLNTLEDLTDGVNHTLCQYGFPEKTRQEVRRALGNGARWLIRSSLPEEVPAPELDQVLKDYEAYYQEHCRIKTGPYDGILELLEDLKRRQVKMAIISNKGDGAVRELNRQYFSEYISTAQGVHEGIRRKPSPDAVLEALKKLESSPKDAVYVGDTEVDYETAKNAGLDCVLVSWGFRDREQLKLLQPDLLIDTPQELLRWFNCEVK